MTRDPLETKCKKRGCFFGGEGGGVIGGFGEKTERYRTAQQREGKAQLTVLGALGGYLSLEFTLTGHRVRDYKSNGFLAECDPQQPPIRVKPREPGEWPPPSFAGFSEFNPNWRLLGIAFCGKSLASLRANPYKPRNSRLAHRTWNRTPPAKLHEEIAMGGACGRLQLTSGHLLPCTSSPPPLPPKSRSSGHHHVAPQALLPSACRLREGTE